MFPLFCPPPVISQLQAATQVSDIDLKKQKKNS